MNVFELFGTIAINNKDANKGIDETTNKVKALQTKLGKAFRRISKDAIAYGKAAAKGIAVISAAGTAAAGALLKSSVSAYAEFEQLKGGIEKLFGAGGKSLEEYAKSVGKSVEEASGEYAKLMAAQDDVITNARYAYKNAGMSMNDYLATSTRLSASLISDLGGDTEAAAKIVDMAIRDMSDNANTYGQDIERIRDAYAGIMRGEYSMLDNLSLGYQGNKSEMARLINDSGVLGKNFKATAENLNKISLAKIYEAIHVMQDKFGIAGVTEAEAKDTISGSFSMLKASWENLVTSMGDEENMEPFVDAFFDAGNKVLMNLAKVLPRIGRNVKDAMERAGVYIHQAWEQNIWPTIQKFVIKFGIELPDWSVIDGSLTSWWSGTGQPAVENIKAFFTDIAAWVSENKEMINGFLVALAGTLLILNAPLALIIAGLVIVAANWKTIKAAVENAITAIKSFFTQTIPQAWKDMVTSIKDWWNTNVSPAINSAITAVNDFFSMPISEQWKAMVQEVANWWTNTAAPAIDSAAIAVAKFFGIEVPEGWSITDTIAEGWNNLINTIAEAIQKVKEFLGIADDPETKQQEYVAQAQANETPTAYQRFAGKYAHLPEAQRDIAWHMAADMANGHNVDQEILQLQNMGVDTNQLLDDISEAISSGEFTAENIYAMFEPSAEAQLQGQLDAMGGLTVTVNPEVAGEDPIGPPPPGYASGLRNVPEDNYLARLHMGEMVLPRNEAETYRKGGQGGADLGGLRSLLEEVLAILRQVATNTGSGTNVVLDSGALVGQLTPRIDAQLGMLAARKERRG